MLKRTSIDIRHVDRETLLRAARFFSSWSGTTLLYSGGSFDSAQTSYLGLFPYESITVQHGHENPWDQLGSFFHEGNDGLAFGFFGYEMGAFSDNDKQLPCYTPETPDAYWHRCALVLALDHSSNTAHVSISSAVAQVKDPQTAEWIDRLSTAQGWHTFFKDLPPDPPQKEAFLSPSLHSDTHPSYLSKVEQAQELIRAGEIYQVNLSQQFNFKGECDPFALFETLVMQNSVPFAAYMNLDPFSLVSLSPERFLQKKGSRLETRPIKGTIVRGKTALEDKANKEALLASPKERSELLMITDLMRNDLAKVSVSGSVVTDEIWRCEAYSNVFHLLSIIHSEAKPTMNSLDIIRHCFPGGSVTGCPKLRAMEVIHDLENRPRGVYTGAIGYIAGNGDFDLNIAIRTLVANHEGVHVQLGGGIVIDSIPEREYEETHHKGTPFFNLLGKP